MTSSSGKILVTYPATARRLWFGERALAAAREVAEVVLNPEDRMLSVRELARLGQGCPALILDRQTAVTDELLAAMPELRAVVRGGVDIRNVDVEAASRHGVIVTQARPAYQVAVSEIVLALILDAARSVSHYAAHYWSGAVPAPRPGRQIGGSTVGVIGYGAISQQLVRSLLALDATVLVHDPYSPPPADMACGLEELLRRSDYVVPMVKATPETEGLIGDAEFALMRPEAWLISCSRGEVVDEAALVRALDEGRIAGAAMDVGMAPDQMPSPTLARRPDVIATPHIGGITRESFEGHVFQAIAQAEAVLQGRMPDGAVNAGRVARGRGWG